MAKKLHWTQRPENKEKVRRWAEKGRKSRAALLRRAAERTSLADALPKTRTQRAAIPSTAWRRSERRSMLEYAILGAQEKLNQLLQEKSLIESFLSSHRTTA